MNRLFEIATELSEIARKRFALKLNLKNVEFHITAREASIIPDGGWPGGNADTRKAMEKAAKATDPELNSLQGQKEETQYDLDELEMKREALLTERDAWQWSIRDSEVAVYGGSKAQWSVFGMMAAHQEKIATEAAYTADMARQDEEMKAAQPDGADISAPDYIPF